MSTSLIYSTTIAFIQEAHLGQKYNNMPYFFHPVEVAEMAQKAYAHFDRIGSGLQTKKRLEDIIIAALLHDVIEDTDYTAEMLAERYVSSVVGMVVLLTSDPDVPYLDNIQKIIDSGNVGAMLVKLSDNHVNREGDKSSFKPERAMKLNDRYDASIDMLTVAIGALLTVPDAI
tara:strand:+ start:278 stop:796 length:519 start_codon:yes stop_codon:yes gene_type:complete